MRVIFIYFFYFYFFIFFFTRMSFSTAPIASTPVAAVAWRYSAVDNLSATFLLGGEGRASTPWLRVLRQGLLPQLRHVLELYIPSQHTTGARGLVADLQARQSTVHCRCPTPSRTWWQKLHYSTLMERLWLM